jgi:hypothetical protein
LEISIRTKHVQIVKIFKPVRLSRTSSKLARPGKVCNGSSVFCGKYYVETTRTIIYRKRTSEHVILETLALLAEGNRISNQTCVKGYKEETI